MKSVSDHTAAHFGPMTPPPLTEKTLTADRKGGDAPVRPEIVCAHAGEAHAPCHLHQRRAAVDLSLTALRRLAHVSALVQRWRCPGYPGLMIAVAAITSVHVVRLRCSPACFGWAMTFSASVLSRRYRAAGHLRLIAGGEAFAGYLLITASGAFISGKAPFART